MRRLLTISISHYCEKARWALDRAGLDYVEKGHYPTFHYPSAFLAARSPMVPILLDGKQVIADSTDILHYVDSLVPTDERLFLDDPVLGPEVVRLEDYFDEKLGPTGRRWGYFHWFKAPRAMLHFGGRGTPRLERMLAPLFFGVARRIISRRIRLNPGAAERDIQRVRAIFDEVSERLSDGRRYLVGDRFTAADLAFASLAAPVLLPVGYGIPLPTVEEAPLPMQEDIHRLRATPAGAHALRLFAEERRRPPQP